MGVWVQVVAAQWECTALAQPLALLEEVVVVVVWKLACSVTGLLSVMEVEAEEPE